MPVRHQEITDPQARDVVIRNRRCAAQRAFRNVEAFIGPLAVGDHAGGVDRYQDRRRIRALAKQAPHERQVSVGQRDHQQQRGDLLRLHRPARVRGRNILEDDVGVTEVVFPLQRLDDAMVCLLYTSRCV